MKKPEGLRRVLLQWVPELGAEPKNLQLTIDKGKIAARQGSTLSFEYRYTLKILVMNYAGDVTTIMVPLLAWIQEQQPELLRRQDGEPFTFEREILDDDLSDIEISIDLTEIVQVAARAEGAPGFAITYVEQPRSALADEFPGVCGVRLWELFMNGDLALQSSDPDYLATKPD